MSKYVIFLAATDKFWRFEKLKCSFEEMQEEKYYNNTIWNKIVILWIHSNSDIISSNSQ